MPYSKNCLTFICLQNGQILLNLDTLSKTPAGYFIKYIVLLGLYYTTLGLYNTPQMALTYLQRT